MKVLYLTNDFSDETGGISQHVDNLTRCVARQADVVVVYLNLQGRDDQYTDDCGRRVYVVPHQGTVAKRITAFPNSVIAELIGSEQPSLVHVHSPLEAIAWRPPNDLPALYTNHSSVLFHWGRHPLIRRHLLPHILRKYTAVICPSQASADRTSHRNVMVIPNGVDVNRFTLEDRQRFHRQSYFRDRWNIDYRQQDVFLTTRRLVRDKRVFELIDANRQFLHDHRDRVMLAVAGDGDDFGRIQSLQQTHQLDNVHLLGDVAHDEIDKLYYASDFCLIPSQYEVFGISAIEALASGSVCLVSAVGGLAEIVEHGISGLHLPSNLSLSDAIHGLEKDRLNEIRTTACQRAKAQYSWESVAKRTLALYADTLENYAEEREPVTAH